AAAAGRADGGGRVRPRPAPAPRARLEQEPHLDQIPELAVPEAAFQDEQRADDLIARDCDERAVERPAGCPRVHVGRRPGRDSVAFPRPRPRRAARAGDGRHLPHDESRPSRDPRYLRRASSSTSQTASGAAAHANAIETHAAVPAAAVVAAPTTHAAESAASDSNRPARPIAPSICGEPMKSNWSFGPGRAPVARSTASTKRRTRSLSFSPS